jgi:hypothetical protein
LGVTLDKKLNFGQHIQNIERKAGHSLGMLKEIKGLGQIKTKKNIGEIWDHQKLEQRNRKSKVEI